MGVDKPNYTQIPNLILDDIMRYMDGAELKVTLAIARHTFGFHRERVQLSITDIEGLTGLSRPAVTGALDVGIRRNMIARHEQENGRFSYSLVVNDDVLATSKENLPVKKVYQSASKESLPVAVKKINQDGKESLPPAVKKVTRATPVLKKEKENSKEKRNEEEERPARLADEIESVWLETYGDAIPENLLPPLNKLLTECGGDAVAHGIRASMGAESRSFKYIAKCARNYIPPAPQPATTYAVDLPGVYRLPAVATPEPAKPPQFVPVVRAVGPLDGLWFRARMEIMASLPTNSDAREWLSESRLEETGTALDNAGRKVPLYTVWITDPKGLTWLNDRAASTLRRVIGSMLGNRIMVVAAMEAEQEAVSA